MAGSISLSMQTIFGNVGQLLAGGKVFFIEAGTTSDPQDAFYDADLTLPLPNPYPLDASGRMPAFYLADGQIKVRIADANGVQQYVQDNILVVGPSSGSGGGGGVDPTTVFQTGDVMWLDVQGSRAGWVRDNGRTIGSASSGATERANVDTSALFVYLWNNFSNAVCPVSTGRGATASADFAANKTITVPDKRGYINGGLDDMGNSAASRYANVPVVSGDVTTAGSIVGEAAHALVAAEHASHDHDVYTYETGHTHTVAISTSGAGTAGGSGSGSAVIGANTISSSANSGVQVRSAAAGGGTQNKTNTQGSGTAHNTVQKTVLGTFYRKL